eukprot:3998937-Amphidinium_carterae.1
MAWGGSRESYTPCTIGNSMRHHAHMTGALCMCVATALVSCSCFTGLSRSFPGCRPSHRQIMREGKALESLPWHQKYPKTMRNKVK